MKTARAIDSPYVRLAPNASVSSLCNDTLRVAGGPAPRRLQQALVRVNDLKRALARSQQESAAARRQVAFLTKAYAQLSRPAIHHEVRAVDSAWRLMDLSLYAGLGAIEMSRVVQTLTKRRLFRKSDVLFRAGDRFKALYAIHSGSCKTVLLSVDGQYQVAGFHMAGEIIGIDGIGTNIHDCQATALEDLEICPIPFDTIENLARLSDVFRQNLNKLLSQESARAHGLMLVLGTMRAEQRLAALLLDLSQRYRALGYSPCEFVLPMTREQIGSYLGLKLETVSRLFARLQREGTLQVQGRLVKLLDLGALSRLVDCGV
jgi:CRP/FNR family transcriptional regulator, anaerobic regulatory protein